MDCVRIDIKKRKGRKYSMEADTCCIAQGKENEMLMLEMPKHIFMKNKPPSLGPWTF